MTRRADRLFQIAELLRGRRLTTAQQLAGWLAISQRTVYRDIRDLQLSGVPIEGEAGIGYRLNRTASLPPLTFTVDELAALAAGARMLESWSGTRLAGGARSALAKIASAMPADKRVVLDRLPVFAPSQRVDPVYAETMDVLHLALDERRVVHFHYRDKQDAATERRIWPLGLAYWGGQWTVSGWCELRGDFRSFDVARMREAKACEVHPDMDGRRLADFLREIGRQDALRGR